MNPRKKIKLSDWLAEKIVEMGIRHVFMVTGGGSMHLNHSLATHPKLRCLFNHHEQASAIAAESYYRLNNNIALVNVTSGPGGTNAITGVFGAYTDSIGMLVISGQVKYETTVKSTGLPLRQFGDQELDIIEIVKSITKYSIMITDPLSIKYHIEKAIYLAKSGRPGPCWIDIPLDIQNCQIDESLMVGFNPLEEENLTQNSNLQFLCKDTLNHIFSAKRPVIFAGNGIRLSNTHSQFLELINKLKIPVVTAFNAHDLIWDTHPLYCGRPGTIGDRYGNFVVQNADLLLILGTRLNIRQVSYNWKSFAREAFKIWVDIDPNELSKPTIKPDLPICSDLRDFFSVINNIEYSIPDSLHEEWLSWAVSRRIRYPVVLDDYWHNEKINPYCFIDKLFSVLMPHDIIIAANATACITSFQAAKLKSGQRLWSNSGSATMGYDLPASIGASLAASDRKIICLAGDGSIMMNLQELETIRGNNLPIKIFILNNNGYLSISHSHQNLFAGKEIGSGPGTGVTFPDFAKLIPSFGIEYSRCSNHQELDEKILHTLNHDGPAACEIMLDEKIQFSPKLSAKINVDGSISSPALEDLSPFLSREELLENLIIKPFDEL
jgi:acetolactate synthase-1/2/3 large subunit